MVDTLTIEDYLEMKATDQSNYIRVKSHIFTIPSTAPILKIDQGILAFKDLVSLGYLASTSKTEISLQAAGYYDCSPSDIGKQILLNGNPIPGVVLVHYDNVGVAPLYIKKWWLSGSTSVASGSSLMIANNGDGAGMTNSDSLTYGGGAIKIGHGLTGPTDPPKISLMDSAQGYNSLNIRMADGTTPAHLDLGNLTTHGHITVSTPAIIMVGDGWGWPATGLLKYSDLDYFGIHTWGDAKPIHIGGSSVVFAAESGNPRLTIDGSGNVSLTGNLHSANSGSGGAYMDLWGNMILNGGSWGHSWNVYNEYGNCILNVPDQGGVHFYDGLGNVKAGITNGGNLSVIGSSSVGVVQYLGYGQGTRGPLYVYASENCYGGTICVNASSERFKQNIEALQDCSWLYNLRPVNFDWKDSERARVDGRQMGLIAEEVYAQNPQLVWLDESGQPEGVHYEWLGVPLLVELQKLRREVDDLKAKLAA